MNFGVHISVHFSTMKNMKILDLQLINFRNIAAIIRVLRIKKRMMNAFLFSIHCFFALIYACLIVPYFSVTETQSELMSVLRELVLFFVLLFYLYFYKINAKKYRFVFHPAFFDENFDSDFSQLIREHIEYPPFIDIEINQEFLWDLIENPINDKKVQNLIIFNPINLEGDRGNFDLQNSIKLGTLIEKKD